jgi:hypothetical protein
MKVVEEYCWATAHLAGRSGWADQVPPCWEFEYQLDCVIYTHTCYIYTYMFDHMYTRLQLAQNSTCARPSGKQLLRITGVSIYNKHDSLPYAQIVTLTVYIFTYYVFGLYIYFLIN